MHRRTGKYWWRRQGKDVLVLSETEIIAEGTQYVRAHSIKGKIVQSRPGVWDVFRINGEADPLPKTADECWIPVVSGVHHRAAAKRALFGVVEGME